MYIKDLIPIASIAGIDEIKASSPPCDQPATGDSWQLPDCFDLGGDQVQATSALFTVQVFLTTTSDFRILAANG